MPIFILALAIIIVLGLASDFGNSYSVSGAQYDFEYLLDAILSVFGILAASLIFLFIVLAVEEKKMGIFKGERKYQKPKPLISRFTRSKNVRRAATALAVLIVVGAGFLGWKIQNQQKSPVAIIQADKIETPQISTEHAEKQELAETLPQSEKLPNGAKSNILVKPSFDAVAARRTLEADIRSWARAWAARRVNDYLGYYSPNFVPTEGVPRGVWEASRRERINNAQDISISIEQMKFLRVEPTQAEVAFLQLYKSTSIAEESQKTLALEYVDGFWKIARENAKRHPKQ
jgi:hypothetical protein